MDVEIRIFWLGMLGSGKLIFTISENNAQQTIPELLFRGNKANCGFNISLVASLQHRYICVRIGADTVTQITTLTPQQTTETGKHGRRVYTAQDEVTHYQISLSLSPSPLSRSYT